MIAAAKLVVLALGATVAQATVLALVAWIVLRRARPALQAAGWLLVIAKFALPWSPALPWSLADAFAGLRTQGGAPVLTGPAGHATEHIGPSPVWLALFAIWAAGAVIVIVRAIRAQRRAHAIARAGTPVTDELVVELAARMRVRARLVSGDAAHGPFVVGFFRPVIVVPPSLLLDRTLLRAALLHELAHVRRRDSVGRLVQLAATALCWWWPVARIANRRLELAREAACDAMALESCDVARPAYARLLLQMATLRPAAAPMLAAPHALDARVAAVLGPQAKTRLGAVHRLALVAFALVGLGGARGAAAHNDPCVYTPQLAEALRQAHPEADRDGDGVLSHDEACDLQASMRRRNAEADRPSTPQAAPAALASFLDEPLGCSYDQGGLNPSLQNQTCGPEGVDR